MSMIGLYRKRCKIYKQLPVAGPSRPSNSGDGDNNLVSRIFRLVRLDDAINLISTNVFPIHSDTSNSFAKNKILPRRNTLLQRLTVHYSVITY